MENISIESVSKRFEEHLAIPNNNRIIFSGKFGIGKTWFLNEFFKERKEAFNKILISPVNYAVSSNEDIFELIKADIIKDLFVTGKIDLKKLPTDNTLQNIAGFVEKKPMVIGNFVLKMLAKLNPATEIAKELIDAIAEIYKSYKNHLKEKNDINITRSEQLNTYIDDITEKIGNIYEHNYITRVINSFLKEVRNDGKKKNVLIIDDLDRIDPEHIFRILNVLSAHNNQLGEENKFAFDYILIVCDIENIKKIFYHKYGKDVDFDGYIDKFYSTEIFEFTNNDAVNNYLNVIFGPQNNGLISLTKMLLLSFNKASVVTVRKLIKYKCEVQIEDIVLHEFDTEVIKQKFNESLPSFIESFGKLQITTKDTSIIKLFKIMSFVFGSFSDFFVSLKTKIFSEDSLKYEDTKDVVMFLELQRHFATRNDKVLFWEKEYTSGASFRYNWPKTRLPSWNLQYRVQLRWTKGNPYRFDTPYFENAAMLALDNAGEVIHDEPDVPWLTESFLAQHLANVIIDFRAAGFLKKSGIVLNL